MVISPVPGLGYERKWFHSCEVMELREIRAKVAGAYIHKRPPILSTSTF